MDWTNVIIWGLIFVAAVVGELATGQLISIWLAVASLAAYLVSLTGVSFFWQFSTFVIVTAVALLLTKKFFRAVRTKFTPTNIDADVGKIAVISEEINALKGTGRAEFQGSFWKAVAHNENEVIDVGTSVRIKEIKSTTLIVEKL
ncbi:MAG: NfeD family protein [Ruminococcus sp.]|jgi:membrane protein implicated in regulation of membrane protease activity|nr:NfeD family protein [Ruminococcus sp.]